jgi:hypothetical protein
VLDTLAPCCLAASCSAEETWHSPSP